MILTCPACGTNYVVKDGAIPPQGRQVRCAACKNSWHQDPEQPAESTGPHSSVASVDPPAAPLPTSDPEPTPPEGRLTDAPIIDPRQRADFAVSGDVGVPISPATSELMTVEPSLAPPMAPEPRMPERRPIAQDAHVEPLDSFPDWSNDDDHGSTGSPRRKGLLVVALLVLLVAALAAAAWFLAPRELMARAGLREASGESPLQLMVTSQDRQKLASGNDLVSLSGRVINPTEQSQAVPPLRADLRDAAGKLVYSWTIAPPAPRLPPRGSASFNAAELGVPANATSLTLRWSS